MYLSEHAKEVNLRSWSQEKVQTGSSESACCNWNDPRVPLPQETRKNCDILLKVIVKISTSTI